MSDLIAKYDQVVAAQAAAIAASYHPGGTDVAVADGGTGSSTASDARTALGLGTLATQSGTFSGTSSGTNTGDQTVPAFATPGLTLGTANAAGAASTVIRSDATLLAFDATGPAAVGTQAVGAATVAARRDHVHATGAGTPSTQAFSDAAATGSGPAAAMTDHKHAMMAAPTTVTGYAAASSGILVPVHEGYVSMFSALGAGTYMLANAEASQNGQASGSAALAYVVAVFYLTAAEYAVAGLTTKLNVEAYIACSGTTPGAGWTATFGLYPVASSGTTGLTYTVGTVVSGSTCAPAWAVNTIKSAVSGDFTLPSDGAFCLAVVTNQSLASNMAVRCGAKLRVRNV